MDTIFDNQIDDPLYKIIIIVINIQIIFIIFKIQNVINKNNYKLWFVGIGVWY